MSKVSIKIQSQRTELDLEDIGARVRSLIPTLQSIYDNNVKAIKSGTGNWFLPNLNNAWYTLDLQEQQVADTRSFHTNEDLLGVIADSQKVLDACNNDQCVQGINFAIEARDAHPTYYRFILAAMVDSVKCPQCQGLYTKGGLNSHIGSMRCMRDAQCLDVAKMGYVIMDDSSAVSAIRKAGIEFKVRPSALDMYVPKWVAQAVKDYRKNRDFAGLKLHEFLKAVKGNE